MTGAAALASGAIPMPSIAQGQSAEISFFYPVAVGGPITKLIDAYAAAFQKEKPGIKVNPIYAGTYQETIVKALTGPQERRRRPVTSVLLSTDMFTLIDEDAIVSDRRFRQDAPRTSHGSHGFFPGFMENSPTGGKTWGVPFQRSTMVLYWNKELFKEAGLDPDKAPENWEEQLEFAKKLTKRDASGNVTQWGIQIPSSGFPYWLFQGLTTQAARALMNQEGTQTYYNEPGSIEALQYWVDLSAKHKVQPRDRRMGNDAEGLLREQGRHDVDDHGQPHECPQQRQVPLRGRHVAGDTSGAAARPAAAISTSPRRRLRRSSRPRSNFVKMDAPRRSARPSGASIPATWPRCPPPTRRPRCRSTSPIFRRPRSPAISWNSRWLSSRPTRTSGSPRR